MLHRPSWFSSACAWSAALVLGAVAAGAASAQARRTNLLLPPGGSDALKKAYTREVREHFSNLSKGVETAHRDKKEDADAIDVTAQWLAYRLTWPEYQTETGLMHKLYYEFDSEIDRATRGDRSANQGFMEMFLPRMAARLKDVLLNEKPIASINAARMLARLVDAGSEEASDALAEALKDPQQNDAVKYWALVGLRHQFEHWAQAAASPDAPPVPKDRKEKEDRYTEAVVGALTKSAEAKPSSREEVLGQRVFRREAVRALGQVRAPAVADDKGTIKVPTALVLLRTAINEGQQQGYSIDLPTEAAIALARMRPAAVPSYQPDYAAAGLGLFVVEFARRAQAADKKVPWNVYAARLSDAIEEMRANAKALKDQKDQAAVTYVSNMVARALPVLKSVELGREANAGDLQVWLNNTPLPDTTLYKGVADSTVKPAEKTEPTKPEKPAEGGKKPEKPAK
jgi:hypothetical protein